MFLGNKRHISFLLPFFAEKYKMGNSGSLGILVVDPQPGRVQLEHGIP